MKDGRVRLLELELNTYQIVNPDESKEALFGVAEMIKRAARIPHEVADPVFEQDVLTARAIYKRIVQEDLKVAIPFDFEYKLEKHADKTTLKAFIALVKAHALVNFADRVRIGPVILATEEDLEAAGNLWRSTRALKIDETAERVLECLPRREPLFDAEIEQEDTDLANYDRRNEEQGLYKASDIASKLQLAPRTVRDKLMNLYDAGLIDRKKSEIRGKPWVSWRVDGDVSTTVARVNEDSYDQELSYTIKNLTDRYGGDADALFTLIAPCRRNHLGYSESLDRRTDTETTAPPQTAEDMGFDGSGGTSGEIEEALRHSRNITAPPKTPAYFDERGQENSAAINTAERQLHKEEDAKNPKLNQTILSYVKKACEDVDAFDLVTLTTKIRLTDGFTEEQVTDAIRELLEAGTLEQITNRYGREAVWLSTNMEAVQ